jgi:hypothetical protein
MSGNAMELELGRGDGKCAAIVHAVPITGKSSGEVSLLHVLVQRNGGENSARPKQVVSASVARCRIKDKRNGVSEKGRSNCGDRELT